MSITKYDTYLSIFILLFHVLYTSSQTLNMSTGIILQFAVQSNPQSELTNDERVESLESALMPSKNTLSFDTNTTTNTTTNHTLSNNTISNDTLINVDQNTTISTNTSVPLSFEKIIQLYFNELPEISLILPQNTIVDNQTNTTQSLITILESDFVEPVLCPLDHFCSEGSTQPQTCPINSVTLGIGSTYDNCTIPDARFGCPEMFFYDRYTDSCTQSCPIGMFGDASTLGFCMNCPLGTFNDKQGSSYCKTCTTGTYSDSIGNYECSQCPFGKTTNFMYGFIYCVEACVATAGTYCYESIGNPRPCPAGYYCDGNINPNTNLYNMVPCPINTYYSGTGASSQSQCLPCAPYTVTLTAGQSQCIVCAAGTKYNDTTQICDACPAGQSSSPNSTTCTSCGLGQYSGAGSTCINCRPGEYAAVLGQTSCTPCPTGTYTYNTTFDQNGVVQYVALWGSTSQAACTNLPNNAGQSLVCLPGKQLVDGSCLNCPIGYYCPTLSTLANADTAIRVCPEGKFSPTSGAISEADCTQNSLLPSWTFEQCALSKNDTGGLSGKTVTAMTASLSRNLVYFTTATAVYRMYLVQSVNPNYVELIAGQEGTPGLPAATAVGSAAMFSGLSAIGVEHDVSEASIAVVGDGQAIRLIKIYSREVILLGKSSSSIVSQPGGIAIKRDTSGARIAYVSDVLKHKIIGFNLENYESFHVAGSIQGFKGSADGSNIAASFWAPRGLAFLERTMNQSALLLVADSGNNRIRQIDTSSIARTVTTWFKPLDTENPEIVSPIGITVATGSATGNQQQQLYYITQGNANIKVIQTTSDNTKLVTPLKLSSTVLADNTFRATNVFTTGSFTTSNSAIGYQQLVVFNGQTNQIKSLVEQSVVSTFRGGLVPATCHLPCSNQDCGSLTQGTLCGNSFLDGSEVCDNANKSGGGCTATCALRPGWTCPVGQNQCADPCLGYNYTAENRLYCSADCKVKTPRPGYRIDEFCVEYDLDECANEQGTTNNCPPQAMCVNTPGNYSCSCFLSYFGDGVRCDIAATNVYTVLEIPAFSRSTLDLNVDSNNAVITQSKIITRNQIKSVFASTIIANLPVQYQNSTTYSKTVAVLAAEYTDMSLDLNSNGTVVLEVSTLFELPTTAQQVTLTTTPALLAAALTTALGTQVNVIQNLRTRPHKAVSFSTANPIEGWGMNITAVNFNRTCEVSGVAPRGGCWQVEMIYVGGSSMPKSNGFGLPVQQSSKNVLYIPRIDHDPITFDLLTTSQAVTMSSGSSFVCDTLNARSGLTRAATACCMRDFNTTYRAHARFKDFLNSDLYKSNVPQDVCDSGIFNDTFPNSNVVYQDPENPDDRSLNDLVVGKLDGMPNSEVRLLETIDYTTRTFRVLLVLEEGDLRLSASLVQGNIGIDYNMTFFVGLANFKGMDGTLSTRNTMQFITVSKSNILTMSSYGANQDPLISLVDMPFSRIKVANPAILGSPVRYLYYLQPLFTMPIQYRAPDDGNLIPLNGIRVIKSTGAVTATDPNWKQACAASEVPYFFQNQTLLDLISAAQQQSCVENDLQMCNPPRASAKNLVQFSIPLPEDYVSASDFRDIDPYTIQVQYIVNAKDTATNTIVRQTVNLAINLIPGQFGTLCEGLTAKQTLADIIQGNIYIGIANTADEWEKTVLKKTNIDAPGVGFTNDNSKEFSTVTVQGAVMTFAALGDSTYFNNVRNVGQYVKISDIQTVHFLEPLGGKGGSTPKFTKVKNLLFQGNAYKPVMDNIAKSIWLEPTPQLLAACPKRPTSESKTCLTRIDSTYQNNNLTRDDKVVLEVIPNTTSVAKLKTMMACIFNGPGCTPTEYTNSLGNNFHNQLVTQLNLNERFRKAYVINPVIDWPAESIQAAMPGATQYTVCSKIIAVGLITIFSASGAPIARRLLSTEFSHEYPNPHLNSYSKSLVNALPVSELLGVDNDGKIGVRSLLQVNSGNELSNDLQPTKTSMANTLELDLQVPGYDDVSQLCMIYNNVPYGKCAMFEIKTLVNGNGAEDVCGKYNDGSFITILQNGMFDSFVALDMTRTINNINVINYDVEGCQSVQPATSDAGRSLLQVSNKLAPFDYAMVTSHVVMTAQTGSMYYDHDVIKYISSFFNSTVFSQFLGGGASVTNFKGEIITLPDGNKTVNIDIFFKNATKPITNTDIANKLWPNYDPKSDKLMFFDQVDFPKSAANALQSGKTIILFFNAMMVASLSIILFA